MQSSALLSVVITLVSLGACQTSPNANKSEEVEPLAYDGILDEMDSLPDCNAETVGSLFWVRTLKAGFECKADRQWLKRGTLAPEDNDFGPRDLPAPSEP